MNAPMPITTTTAPSELRDGRSLIADKLFDRMTARIAAEHPELAPDMPPRILDQALAFLGAAAVTTRPLSPSSLVDIGWHTFILYTSDYRDFCARLAGRFIDHVPDDDPDTTSPALPGTVADMMVAIADAGYRVDDELWPAAADCTQCHEGCHNSPGKLIL